MRLQRETNFFLIAYGAWSIYEACHCAQHVWACHSLKCAHRGHYAHQGSNRIIHLE